MVKGYQANQERIESISSLGKAIGKRAGFKCEWCEGKDDLRVWDYQPSLPPEMENLAMLCRHCREIADGKKADANQLRSIRNALWSNTPAVAEGAASVLVQCKEAWVQEAIEDSFIDDGLKEQLLAKTKLWK